MEPDEEWRKAERRRVLNEIERICWESINNSVCTSFCFIFIVMLFVFSMASTIAIGYKYNKSSNELETLKSEEREYLRVPDITKQEKDTTKLNLNRLAKKIEEEEYTKYELSVCYIVCLSSTISIPAIALLAGFLHGVSEYWEHIGNTEYCWETCPFLWFITVYFRTSRFENLVTRAASDLSVIYNRAGPENVAFQCTRNIEESVVQETSAERRIRNREEGVVQETYANLPGVPSTSNN